MAVNKQYVRSMEDLEKESLTQKIELVIERLPNREVTLAQILEIIGNDSLLLLTIFLALVFLVPVSIPGVSTVFGSAILLIGLSRLFNRPLRLPERIAHRTPSSEKLEGVLNRALIWFRRLEKVSRSHRLQWFTADGKIGLVNKLAFLLAVVMLMLPFGLIPFSNTLPALALIFLAVGWLQKDGGSILLGHLSNLATLVYFAVLIAGGGMGIMEALRHFAG